MNDIQRTACQLPCHGEDLSYFSPFANRYERALQCYPTLHYVASAHE